MAMQSGPRWISAIDRVAANQGWSLRGEGFHSIWIPSCSWICKHKDKNYWFWTYFVSNNIKYFNTIHLISFHSAGAYRAARPGTMQTWVLHIGKQVVIWNHLRQTEIENDKLQENRDKVSLEQWNSLTIFMGNGAPSSLLVMSALWNHSYTSALSLHIIGLYFFYLETLSILVKRNSVFYLTYNTYTHCTIPILFHAFVENMHAVHTCIH